jgi:hypothetical protein
MSWGAYGILIVFGLFIILMIINPSLSCFGKKIKSPFYPLLRKKKQKEIQAQDYGFDLEDGDKTSRPPDQREDSNPG